MLRIHFTDRDLARTRVATSPEPLWEVVLALHVLTGPRHRLPLPLTAWRNRVRAQVRDTGIGGALRMLQTLAPAEAEYFPDFLTPAESEDGLTAGLEALRATPRPYLRRDIAELARTRHLPRWAGRLAEGERGQTAELADAVRLLHRTVVEPGWGEVAVAIEADRAVRAQAIRDGGVIGLLESLRPMLCWDDPVLEARYPAPMDVHLRGRGIRLIPSYFCSRMPVVLVDPQLPPVVVYPVDHSRGWAPAATRACRPQALADLLGPTRARVLAGLTHSATTGALARMLSISPASASMHISRLRTAGLARTVSANGRVLHTLTPLGDAVLHGDLPLTAPPG